MSRRLRRIALGAAVGLVLCAACMPTAGHAVYRGTDTSTALAPWAAFLTSGSGPYCSGVLISANLVVTAAHCMYRDDGEPKALAPLRVVLGRDRPGTSAGTAHRVRKRWIHAQYTGKSDYDLAALQLKSPSAAQPMRLPEASDTERWQPGQQASVAGWGAVSPSAAKAERAADILRTAPLPIRRCDEGPTILCAGAGKRSEPAICAGDSGGPLAVTGEDGGPLLVGIAQGAGARSKGCATRGPGYFVDVAGRAMRRWLLHRIGLASAALPSPGPPVGSPARDPIERDWDVAEHTVVRITRVSPGVFRGVVVSTGPTAEEELGLYGPPECPPPAVGDVYFPRLTGADGRYTGPAPFRTRCARDMDPDALFELGEWAGDWNVLTVSGQDPRYTNDNDGDWYYRASAVGSRR